MCGECSKSFAKQLVSFVQKLLRLVQIDEKIKFSEMMEMGSHT